MFRRRNPAEPAPPAATSARSGGGDESDPTAARKGRPTPSRKEAERLRRERLSPPKDRRAAARQARERARAERAKGRQALLSGDERALPPRDAGPLRALARDYVDSRRSAGEFFLPGAGLVLVLNLIPNLTAQTISMFLWMAMILLIVLDTTIMARGLSREASRRFPDQPRRGLILYAVMRSMQIRRLRLPPPRVKPGMTI